MRLSISTLAAQAVAGVNANKVQSKTFLGLTLPLILANLCHRTVLCVPVPNRGKHVRIEEFETWIQCFDVAWPGQNSWPSFRSCVEVMLCAFTRPRSWACLVISISCMLSLMFFILMHVELHQLDLTGFPRALGSMTIQVVLSSRALGLSGTLCPRICSREPCTPASQLSSVSH
jgi:hypothetical protein